MMRSRERLLGTAGAAYAIAGLALLVGSNHPAAAATVVNTFNGWTLYGDAAAGPICFVAGPPSASVPTDVQRQQGLLYVSAWPKDGVKAEISVKLGFPARKASDTILSITGQTSATFKLAVTDDRAFVTDATQELKLLDAMKKGSKLTVQAVSDHGVTVTDTYSLQGITAALQALGSGCP